MAINNAKIVLKRIILGKNYHATITENENRIQEIHFSMSSIFPNKDAEETVLKILSEIND